MALSSRAKTNSRGSKLIASNGNKRKRDGTSDIQSKPISKKRTGSDSVLAVPSKQTDCQKALEEAKIVKEFRITFHPRKFDPQRPGNVPEEHQTKFRHIQQLGQISYDSYALQPRPDTANKPWELENKLRATRVSARAIQARNEYQNEDGWRTKLDNLVFERFEIEVACQECRKRRWQSFVEVNPEESNSRTKNLAERQHRRTVCDCKPSSKQYSILSTGLTDMFTTRIGERSVIQDDPENHRRIEMRPDRIYGLNTTDTIRNILEQPHVSHLKEVSELDDDLQGRLTVSCNPDSGGEVSIYPFLVMEAKSLKSGTTFPDIETQTAVPIRNHLYLQLKLQDDKFNNMPTPGGPLTWFLAYVGETWRVYGCYVTKSSPGNSPCYEIVRLWQGDITGYDEALQLVLIMDYIVDWARDIFRPSIMRQLMSVVDKGEQSSYTIVDQPDILSIHDPANSRYGGRPVPTIAGAGTFEAPAESAFDAVHSTISSSFEPLFESTGKHVDIKVWESAKYESRVRGLFITEHDSAAMNHLTTYGYKRLETVYMSRCWFLLPNSKDIRTIEEAWTGSTPAEIKDVSDPSEQKILISLYVQFRNDEFGAPIRELTYLAFTGSVVKQMRYERDINGILERDELVASPEVLGLKLSEAWTSSHNNYFQRYASGEISVLRVTASDHDKMSDSVSLSFLNDRDTTNYARRLDSFIKNICEHPRANLHKVYAPCFRYTKVVHSLTVKPHCILDPTQACVFINAKAMPSGICIYAKNGASEKTNHEWVIRHLVQIVVVLWDSQWPDTKGSFYIRRYMFESRYIDSKILLWIVSDPQWDLYTAMKPSLTMPGTERVHEHLAWFRKVLLTHKCGTGTIRSNVTGCGAHRAGYRNVQRHIQEACKKCDYDTSFVAPKFPFCDEDFMPGGFDGNLKESSVH